ncbi:MAG TPA: M56 family metallopeptidase [Chitinophagaceae bacterium]|nr:M56 family metallopeptidase [Chitinophagaceae bacterium]
MTLPYIINAALVLGACLAFYKVLLRRETFYRANRFILILCLGLAFALPLISVPQKFSLRRETENQKSGIRNQESGSPVAAVTPTIPTGSIKPVNKQPVTSLNPTSNIQPPSSNPQQANTSDLKPNTSAVKITFSQVLSWISLIYWFGVIVFGASFLFQAVLLFYRSRKYPAIIDGRYRIVELTGDKAPCSFGNTIFINPEKYDWETYSQIILHEKIHIRERHTIDIILAELSLIFQWFNPFAWTYRREIESNLEFLTDDQLVQHKEVDKQSYQLSLVKVSAPHLPLSLTTNYNQSILKKRIAMMNTKRSNLHTAWKYFFLLPVLALLASLLNEPVAKGQTPNVKHETKNSRDIGNEGYWFAVIKGDKVNIRFSDEKMDSDKDDFKMGNSFSGNSFTLAELGTLPRGTSGTFYLTREAGKMEMTGKFDGNTGMGTYKFTANKDYFDYMNKELTAEPGEDEKLDEDDQLAFFFINIKKEYLAMLRKEGFAKVTKDNIIPMAALNIDGAYIRSIKDAGFKDVDMENLVPLKALGVDGAYIKEIREAGIKNIDLDKLVSYKAQGIDKEYIKKVQKISGKEGKDLDEDDADNLVTFKAMGIDEDYIKSFKAIGLDVPHEQLVSFKALGITPEYIKGWQDAGYKNIDIEEYVGLKSQNVTPEYLKSFTDLGYKNVDPQDMVAFKALGITPEYIKSFEAAGFKNIDLDELPGLKSQGVTPDLIKSYQDLGFKDIDLGDMIAVKAMGVTPAYIKEMRAKGMNYDKLQKYVTLKSID